MTAPVNRRAALGSLAAAGAVLAVPMAAKAAGPDAELFALVEQAKALQRAYEDAQRTCDMALARVAYPPVPAALVFTELDRELFSFVAEAVGNPIEKRDFEKIRRYRERYVEIFDLIDWRTREPRPGAREMLQRAIEIEDARETYELADAAAHDAAGATEASADVDRLEAECARLWRDLATTPARTVAGVLAKLDAVAGFVEPPYESGEWPERATSKDVIEMAAVDFAALATEV